MKILNDFGIRIRGRLFTDLLLTTDMLDFLGFFLRRNTAHKWPTLEPSRWWLGLERVRGFYLFSVRLCFHTASPPKPQNRSQLWLIYTEARKTASAEKYVFFWNSVFYAFLQIYSFWQNAFARHLKNFVHYTVNEKYMKPNLAKQGSSCPAVAAASNSSLGSLKSSLLIRSRMYVLTTTLRSQSICGKAKNNWKS